jgi:hypothetical protein
LRPAAVGWDAVWRTDRADGSVVALASSSQVAPAPASVTMESIAYPGCGRADQHRGRARMAYRGANLGCELPGSRQRDSAGISVARRP